MISYPSGQIHYTLAEPPFGFWVNEYFVFNKIELIRAEKINIRLSLFKVRSSNSLLGNTDYYLIEPCSVL